MKQLSKYKLFLILIFSGLLLFLAFNRHSRSGVKNYHAQIWADKAGYYVYLPLTFIYGFDARNFPQGLDEKTGNGFRYELDKGKVWTKYPYGVALMQLPFFLATHWITPWLGYENDGFSLPYNRMLDIAGVFYLILGLICLFKFFKTYYQPTTAFLITSIALLCTNLLYYGIDETGMSHVYSFFWFSFFLLNLRRFLLSLKTEKADLLPLFYAGIAAAMIIIIRPFNALFLFSTILLDAETAKDIHNRILLFFKKKYYRFFLFPITLALIPQFVYWNYLRGMPVTWSYEGESFIYWNNPQLLKVWFSPNNGLFTYNPVWFLIISAIIWSVVKKKANAMLPVFFFVVVSYLVSSWWCTQLGCGFGYRAFVEYLPVFFIPVAAFAEQIKEKKKTAFVVLSSVVLLTAIWNIKLMYSWDGCWYSHDWDFAEFFRILTGPAK